MVSTNPQIKILLSKMAIDIFLMSVLKYLKTLYLTVQNT